MLYPLLACAIEISERDKQAELVLGKQMVLLHHLASLDFVHSLQVVVQDVEGKRHLNEVNTIARDVNRAPPSPVF